MHDPIVKTKTPEVVRNNHDTPNGLGHEHVRSTVPKDYCGSCNVVIEREYAGRNCLSLLCGIFPSFEEARRVAVHAAGIKPALGNPVVIQPELERAVTHFSFEEWV